MTTPHHDCASTEYKPSLAAQGYHRYRGEPDCEYARGCVSYYGFIKRGRHGEWPGWDPKKNEHDCASTDYVPSQVAYQYHYRRGESACCYARMCLSYYRHSKSGKPGEWPGCKLRNMHEHDCDSSDYEPSPTPYNYHYKRGEPGCGYSRACLSYHRHIQKERPGEWSGWPPRRHEHDCDSTEYEPSSAPYSYHRYRAETACDYSLACQSYYRHIYDGRTGEWPGWKPRKH